MFALTLVVGVAGLAAVVAGNYLQHVVARRALGGVSLFQELPAHAEFDASSLPRAPHLRPVMPDERPRRHFRLRPSILRRPSASTGLFVACFLGYTALAGVLVLGYGSVVGDAHSRVANAWYVFFSRDPHLAAIGFVWNPLPSVLTMPFLALKGLWPALTERAFAGNLISALCAAGCVVQFRSSLMELRVRKSVTWVLVAIFALNPMFVYYAANGMSETIYLFFLLFATRYLAQWLRTARVRPLVLSGIGFGLGYLARYETAAAAGVAIVLVGVVTFMRSQGSARARRRLALVETIVFSLPFVASFIAWAGVSYVIKGEAFIQLDANAGNTLLIRAAGGITKRGLGGTDLPVFAAKQLLAFGPVLPILVAVAVLRFWKQRSDFRVLAAAPFLGALLFTYVVFVKGGLFPWFRYYIPALPLSLILVGVLLPRSLAGVDRSAQFLAAFPAVVVALAVGLAGTIGTSVAMWDPFLGGIERGSLTWIANGGPRNAQEREEKYRIQSVQRIAADLDRRDLPSGSIVVDTNTVCVSLVLMNMQRPHVFVVPSDRDWERRLADPLIFHSKYLLIPPATGNSALDNVGRSYPGLYDTGGGIAKLVTEYDTPSCPKFRLYRLTRSPDVGHGGPILN